MPNRMEATLPLPEPGGLFFLREFVPHDERQALAQDLTAANIGDSPRPFDIRWHPQIDANDRLSESTPLLTGSSRNFVRAQSARLDVADRVEAELGPELKWRKMGSYVRMYVPGKGKPLDIDGVRDVRVIVATGYTDLKIGPNVNPNFKNGMDVPMAAGDALVVNNLCTISEQPAYSIDLPPTAASQALLYFSITQ